MLVRGELMLYVIVRLDLGVAIEVHAHSMVSIIHHEARLESLAVAQERSQKQWCDRGWQLSTNL